MTPITEWVKDSFMTVSTQNLEGKWGEVTEDGQEIWWSGINESLLKGRIWSRFIFFIDFRHFFLIRFLKRAISASQRPCKIIDFGCGTGGSTFNFSAYLQNPIDGYDVFPLQIDAAKAQAQKFSLPNHFGLIDSELLEVENAIDIIFSSDVLGHVPSVPKTLSLWNQILKKHGYVALFTEATFNKEDNGVMARLSREGLDMIGSIPGHISLFTREDLERMFFDAGFEVLERYNGGYGYAFFHPSNIVSYLKSHGQQKRSLYLILKIWDRFLKLIPFYPKPIEVIRIFATLLFGRNSYSCNYFYLLRKTKDTN